METILTILQKSTQFLEKKRVEYPKLNAEHLIAYALNCSRLELYMNFNKVLDSPILDTIRGLIIQRGNRKPLQYIIGNQPFMGNLIKVDSRGLIPRPETEELIEWILQIFANTQSIPQTILDLGTGTGAIAITLATYFPTAHLIAVDKSEPALELAKENVLAHNFQDRIELLYSDWFENIPSNNQFDLIVSNPPYLTTNEWISAEPEVRDFEPKTALVSGEKGIDDLIKIIQYAKLFLKPQGIVALETGIHHHDAIKDFAKSLNYTECMSKQDLSKRNRFIILKN